MTAIVLWTVLACGVDAGYEPAADGRLEYIIQIEPQLLGSLATGHDITSEVPRGLDVRHYRLTVGNAALPHLNVPAGSGQTGAAGGARPANTFEAQGRVDEAVGTATPQIHVGYELISATGGQYVIEIDPHALGDLNQADLTGDIPPGLPVTRFVISTNPGTAPTGTSTPPAGSPYAPAVAAMPSAEVPVAAGVADDDPSVWQRTAPLEKVGSPPPTGQAPAISPGSLPDDPPAGGEPPPAAMPPHRMSPEEPAAAPGAGQQFINPPDGTFHPNGFGAAGSPTNKGPGGAAEAAPALEVPPRPMPTSTSGLLPTPTVGVGETDPEGQPYAAKKHPAPSDDDPPRGAGGTKGETSEATKPWLPFTVALLCLFASLGGNVFLGWVAWDSYNRGRPGGEKLVGRKPSLSS